MLVPEFLQLYRATLRSVVGIASPMAQRSQLEGIRKCFSFAGFRMNSSASRDIALQNTVSCTIFSRTRSSHFSHGSFGHRRCIHPSDFRAETITKQEPASTHSSKPVDTVSTKEGDINPQTLQEKTAIDPYWTYVDSRACSMPRYPELSAGGFLRAGDYFGTVCFAMTGTLTACSCGLDMLGATIVGTITAVGGGTIRDILLGHELGKPKRAFWIDEPEYLLICALTCALTFLFWNEVARKYGLDEDDPWVFWGDAVGVGIFCVIGTMNGIRCLVHPAICIICGMMTATFGGMLRDVLCKRPVRILHSHKEMYATPALLGSSAYLLARLAGAPLPARALAGFATAVGLRYAAMRYDIRLPVQQEVYQHKRTLSGRIPDAAEEQADRAREEALTVLLTKNSLH